MDNFDLSRSCCKLLPWTLSACRQNYRCVGGIIGVSAELSACRQNYRCVGGIIGVSAELSACRRNHRCVGGIIGVSAELLKLHTFQLCEVQCFVVSPCWRSKRFNCTRRNRCNIFTLLYLHLHYFAEIGLFYVCICQNFHNMKMHSYSN